MMFKLRSDLIISRQESPEGAIFVLKDPTTGRFFRFKEAEQFIAEQLDGSTALEDVQRRVEEQFGTSLTLESLGQFVEKLRQLGLLETERAEHRHVSPQQGRIRGSLLYLRLKAFDPDQLLNRLLPRVRFFFTTTFVAISS